MVRRGQNPREGPIDDLTGGSTDCLSTPSSSLACSRLRSPLRYFEITTSRQSVSTPVSTAFWIITDSSVFRRAASDHGDLERLNEVSNPP